MPPHKKKIAERAETFTPEKVRNFILCLYYLNQEAKQNDLWVIADVLQQSIATIEKWTSNNRHQFTINDYINHSVYYALEFLDKFRTLSQDKQKALAALLEQKDLHETLEELKSSTVQ